jgi:hypothetical protein
MTSAELTLKLRTLRALSTSLCGRMADGTPLNKALPDYFDKLLAAEDDPKTQKARADFLDRAKREPAVYGQLCELRVEQFRNYALATQNIINMFYEVVTLGDKDRPAHQNETMQEVAVTYVGQDGAPDDVKIVKPQDELLIPLHLLSTANVRYRKWDIYNGMVADAALATIMLAYDMANQREKRAWDLYLTCFGAFTLTGKKSSRVYVANSRVVTANLPDSNIIDGNSNVVKLTGNSSTTKFRPEVLRAAQKYADLWVGAFPNMPVTLTGRVLVPSIDASDLGIDITPSTQQQNPVAEELLLKGWYQVTVYGRTWTLVPDNTLPSGICYPEFTRKPGRVYLKPSGDREVIVQDSANDKKNQEERYMQSPFGAAVNQVSKVCALQIKYKTGV